MATRRSITVSLVLAGALLNAGAVRGSGLDGRPTHPLDPLTGAEITSAARLLQAAGKVNDRSRFSTIVLHEPPKAEVLRHRPGTDFRREAFAVVYQPDVNLTYETVVDLRGREIVSWEKIPGVQPAVMAVEFDTVQAVVRNDPRWQQALRKRGIDDFSQVQVDPWSAGHFDLVGEEGIRIVRAVAYYRGKGTNAYARPIEGVVAYVDLNAKKVFQLIDTGVAPLSKTPGDLDPASIGKLRPAPKPLQISQPQGRSFTVQGHEVRWQNWRFRFALHPREGVVLYTVGYEDGGKVRPILYRGSLSEMVVPYGDPGPAWFFRNAFDMGEYGMGLAANSLVARNDCPPNAAFFDAVLPTNLGTTYTVPKAIALYERDGGVLWRHENQSRRARQLVLSYFVTAGNYDYGFDWIFHQDGTLEMDVLLTGIMTAKGVLRKSANGHGDDRHGHLVDKRLEAVHHQHFMNFRLDLDVDGPVNRVVEMNTEGVPAGPNNPYQNAIVMKETLLRSEKAAQRQLNLATNRKWKVINPDARNVLGQPTGYVLVPGANAVPYAGPESSIRRRAGFVSAHLWVTPCVPKELYAAGSYVNQSRGGEGLPRWTRADRPLTDEDVVLWYTLGVTHVPRPEEWPVMPVHHAGFKLAPAGFFARNPALDVPPVTAGKTTGLR
jgi:primary-amine oxidase